MVLPDTSLGFNRVDGVTDDLRDGHLAITNNAQLANDLFLEDRARLDVLEAPAETVSADWAFVPEFYGGHWQAALATDPKPVIAIIGDSIAQKFNAESIATSWAGRLRTALQGLYGDGGSGFMGVSHSSFTSANWAQYPVEDRCTLTGTWTQGSDATSYQGPGINLLATTVVNSTATFTVRGSIIDVYIFGLIAAGQNYTVKIDAGSEVTFNTGSKGADAPYRQNVTTSASAGTHTVVVKLTGTGLNLYGVSGENATGVVVNNFGRGGATSAPFRDANPNSSIWNGGTSYPADLVIWAMGLNDSTADHTNKVAALTASQSIRRHRDQLGVNAPDYLILVNHGSGKDTAWSWHLVPASMRELAENKGASLVDIGGYFGGSVQAGLDVSFWGTTNTMGPPGTDSLHPGTIGHGIIYDRIAPLVLGGL